MSEPKGDAGSSAERVARGAPMPSRTLWVNGALRRGEDATLSLFDRGARDGEGLFETLRVYELRPFLWERHMERLVLAAAELGFPVPPSARALRRGIEALLDAEELSDAVVRITVTRGIAGGRPTRAGCWIEAEPVGGRLWRGTRSGAASIVLTRRPFALGSTGGYKTTSRIAYHLAREECRAAGADETILVTAQGQVLEGAVSNVFVVVDGEVATPSLSTGILPGITREWVLLQLVDLGARIRTSALWRSELSLATEIFLTNAVQGIVTVGTVEGRAVPERSLATTLRERYALGVAALAASGEAHSPR